MTRLLCKSVFGMVPVIFYEIPLSIRALPNENAFRSKLNQILIPTNMINVNVCENGGMDVCYSFTKNLPNGFFMIIYIDDNLKTHFTKLSTDRTVLWSLTVVSSPLPRFDTVTY